MAARRLLAVAALSAVLLWGVVGCSDDGGSEETEPSTPAELVVDPSQKGEFSSTNGTWVYDGEGLWKLDMGITGDSGDDIYGRCLPTGTLVLKTLWDNGGMQYVLNGCTDGEDQHPR